MNAEQEKALREYLQEAIVPLIEQVLVKKLGQAMSFAAQELVRPKREWQGLMDEEIYEMDDLTDEPSWEQILRFVRAVEAKLKEKNT